MATLQEDIKSFGKSKKRRTQIKPQSLGGNFGNESAFIATKTNLG